MNLNKERVKLLSSLLNIEMVNEFKFKSTVIEKKYLKVSYNNLNFFFFKYKFIRTISDMINNTF